MDDTTRRAFRAVIRGLWYGRVLSGSQVAAIMSELQDEAAQQRDRGEQAEADELMELASDIGKDTRIADRSTGQAEPPAATG